MFKRMRTTLAVLFVLLMLVPATALAAKPGGVGGGGGGGGTTWTYTALGDSLGTGFGATKGYVPRYADYLAADNAVSVSLTNTSVNGWTSSDLLAAIKTDRKMRNAVAKSHVVTWNIGGNDLRAARTSYKNGTCGGAENVDCLEAAVVTFRSNWNEIVSEVKALRAGKATIYRTMDIYNPYVNEDKADGSFTLFKGYLDQVNGHIYTQATTYGYLYAQVYAAFNGPNGDIDPGDKGYLFIDGLHPNDTGHRVIADLLRGLGYSPLK